MLETYAKLGIPLKEQEFLAGVVGADKNISNQPTKVAVDAVFDSVSVGTTFKEELEKLGIIFCSISEAIRSHPDLVKKYIGTVVPRTDNYFATLNFSFSMDLSYIPEGIKCPMELSTYFRINAENTGQLSAHLSLLIKDLMWLFRRLYGSNEGY